MPNTLRWRYGDTNPVLIPVDADTVIEIGDLLYFDTDDVKPASAQTDQSSLGANQQLFHDVFAGVAMQASPAGEDRAIRVATTGVFEFDCASATIEVGQLIGATENGEPSTIDANWFTSSTGWSAARPPRSTCLKNSIITGTFIVLAAWNEESGAIVTSSPDESDL